MSTRKRQKWHAAWAAQAQRVRKKTERANTSVEPLTYHGYTRTVWEELLHCHSAAGMIDLTVGAGYAAEAALHLKVPYVGLVQTPTHELVVRRYLFRRLWGLMNGKSRRVPLIAPTHSFPAFPTKLLPEAPDSPIFHFSLTNTSHINT